VEEMEQTSETYSSRSLDDSDEIVLKAGKMNKNPVIVGDPNAENIKDSFIKGKRSIEMLIR
jgi:hypothetical protein